MRNECERSSCYLIAQAQVQWRPGSISSVRRSRGWIGHLFSCLVADAVAYLGLAPEAQGIYCGGSFSLAQASCRRLCCRPWKWWMLGSAHYFFFCILRVHRCLLHFTNGLCSCSRELWCVSGRCHVNSQHLFSLALRVLMVLTVARSQVSAVQMAFKTVQTKPNKYPGNLILSHTGINARQRIIPVIYNWLSYWSL